jgi:hypothetical protein
MTKDDMIQVLKSVGVNENTVTAMVNAFDMGVDYEREACVEICKKHVDVYAVLPKTLAAEAGWAACADLMGAIKARS